MVILERDKSNDEFKDSIRIDPISTRFVIGKTIARGKFGVVKKLTDRSTGATYAGKFVKRGDVEREARLLHEVCYHSFIIGLEAFYMNPNLEMVIVMELARGGDIFEHCVGKMPFSETEARDITRQLISALDFIHQRHIVHMDIKPQNILLGDDGTCRLADFGLSRKIPPGEHVQEISGTPEYTAPEILDYSPITTAADIWSLGCVIYVMLSGLSPFAGDTIQETYLNVSQVNLTFTDDEWKDASSAVITVIENLCTRMPSDRPKAGKILDEKWFLTDFSLTITEDKSEEMVPTIRRRSRRSRREDEIEKIDGSNQSGDSDSGVSVSDEDSFNSTRKSNMKFHPKTEKTKCDFFRRRELRRKIYQIKLKTASINTPTT